MNTFGNSTLSVTVARFSEVITGAGTSTFGTGLPAGIEAEILLQQRLHATALSMSPTIAMLALLGA